MRSATKLTLLTLAAAAWTIVSCNSSVYAQPLVDGDLVVYYDFDEIVSDQFLDESGNSYDGDIHQEFAGPGSLTLDTTNPKRGAGAANFDQSIEELDDPVYIDAQGEAITDDGNAPSTAVTYAAWVNLEETGSDQTVWQARSSGGTFQTHFQVQGNGRIRLTLREGGACCTDILSQQLYKDGSPDPSSLQSDFDGNGASDGDDFLTWQENVGTGTTKAEGDANDDMVVNGDDLEIWSNEFGTVGDNSFDFNQWVHLAGTYDMAANEWTMYYNGAQIATGEAIAGQETKLLGDWGGQVDFGDFFAAGTGAVPDSGGRRTQGLMDELYVFKRALTPEEVGTLALLPMSAPLLAAVPEPGSIVLLALAGVALTTSRRRTS